MDTINLQSCVRTFKLSFKNHPQNVLLPTPKLHYGAIFQAAKTWQECFYTTVLCTNTKLTTSNPQISVGLMMMDSDTEQIIWVSYACIKDDVMGKGEVIV